MTFGGILHFLEEKKLESKDEFCGKRRKKHVSVSEISVV